MNNNNRVFVLYKVSNNKDDESALFNAFSVTRNHSGGLTLADIKRACVGLSRTSSSGSDGFHWRVRMDDKTGPNYKWWDIKDENSRLPIKENVPLSELDAMFGTGTPARPSFESVSSSQPTLGGAVRGFGKALKNAATQLDDAIGSSPQSIDPNEPRVSVLTFKVLDLGRVQSKFGAAAPVPSASLPRRRGRPAASNNLISESVGPASNAAPLPSARPSPQQQQHQRQQQQQRMAASTPPVARRVAPPPTAAARSTADSLLDFGAAPAATPRAAAASTAAGAPSYHRQESKEEKLKRDYAKKAATQNRVWDEIDQRWVVEEAPGSTSSAGGGGGGGGPTSTSVDVKSNIVGISLDAANTAGKSAEVAAAMTARVQELKASQDKAKDEWKERESKKKQSENEEDEVRKRLEPKVKQWSEEHGQKKQLQALLSSMHTILWDGAKWKQVSLGDLLEDKKLRRCYLRATLVVHPDKTADLGAEQRFLAKRIFDALTQAHTEYQDKQR